MAGFEEVRLLEGMQAPLQVRLELRQTFERWLSRLNHHSRNFEHGFVVDELALLDLCQHYRLEYPGSAEDIAKSWDDSELRIADGGLTFEDLTRLGWVFFDGGRWVMQRVPVGASSHVKYPSPSTRAFLIGLGKARLVAEPDTSPPPRVQALAIKIMTEILPGRHIPTRNPDSLAGRLWQQLCPKPQARTTENSDYEEQNATLATNDGSGFSASPEAEAETVDRSFVEWSAWCDVLGAACKWDNEWAPDEKRYCREAAHRALQRQTLWGTWDNDIERYSDVLQNTYAIPHNELRYFANTRTSPPRSLVSRADWLKWPEIEHLVMERFGMRTVGFAFGLLCSELEGTDIGPSVSATANTVLSFAADHPMALQHLLFRIEGAPALLVDMLMHPRTACLAAKCAIQWRPQLGRGNDRNASREAQTKAFAVQDALSLLAHHLDEGRLDLEECASLVTWCYVDGIRGVRALPDSRRPIGEQLLRTIAKEKVELQCEVLRYLIEQAADDDRLPRARFAGVLEGLSFLSNELDVDVLPIVALYSKFARDRQLDWTDASCLSSKLAARLVATALTQNAPDRDALLIPFDTAKLLQETPEDGRPSLRSSIAQTLREHVRLLARAIAGWPDGVVPKELSGAFLTLISRSVIEHAEKGRVGALTDSYGSRRFLVREEGSPAQDLTAAWRRLDERSQESMLRTLVQSDDPALLAELCQHLPTASKPILQERLRQLKPGEASELWTWPELQHRVEFLLIAGEYELAREHMDETVQDLNRAPQEFQLGLFGLELRLLLQEKNWTALDGVTVPPLLDMPGKRQAHNQLDFYRATSQLLRQNGNLEAARVVLQRLSKQPGAASAYKENAFAVAMQQLLGPQLHPLTGADKVTGEGLLAEINAAIDVDEQPASSLLANRGLLLLALEKPEDALKSVVTHRREIRSPDIELVAVLAKFEMGFQSEAMAILEAAIAEFGPDDQLIVVRDDLQAGVVTTTLAPASATVDLISSIRTALHQLTELPPTQVGDVLGPPGRGVRGYLVRQVSRAVATLQHMAAILRDRKNPEDTARFENDLNTAVREVLGASLAVVKWDVADQSLGGATANGNPGERDAVIRASGQEISIYEALVCSRLDRGYIKGHFDKLLSYGVCDIYFHVTYSYAKELKPLLDYIRQMLEHEIPPDLAYLGCEIVGPPNYETSGYIATYRAEHREIAVVFLIADLKT